jgi:coenzyme F420-reducing hydrogenase alpha subunit
MYCRIIIHDHSMNNYQIFLLTAPCLLSYNTHIKPMMWRSNRNEHLQRAGRLRTCGDAIRQMDHGGQGERDRSHLVAET